MKQQSHVDEGFDKIKSFVSENIDNMLLELSAFKEKVQDESNKVTKLVDEMSMTVRDLDLKQTYFEKQQNFFGDQLDVRKKQCDDLNAFFHRVDDEGCKKTVYAAGFEVLEATIRKLADENLSQQYEINTLSNYADKYLPIRIQH